MYDVEYNVVASMEEKSSNGYILLNKNMLYIGCNKVASSIFNELDKIRIDFPLNNKDGICGEIPKWVEELEKDKEKEELSTSYKIGEKHYQCNVKYLYYNEKECGYIIEVIDDTEKNNYIELLNSYNTELVNEVEEKTAHIMDIQDKILYTMSNMVENRDVEDEDFIKIAVNIAIHHHEKWNGTGYPDKLSKDNIPLEARIMAIADVYDALVSKRCYKEKMSFEEANKVIIESMGRHFDPGLRKYYEMARPEIEAYYVSQGE